MEDADTIVQRCLDIVSYYQPSVWVLENPSTGYLKQRDVVEGLPYYTVHYCAYEDIGRMKKTNLWTNVTDFVPKVCAGRGRCPSMVGRRHRCTCTGKYWDPKWGSVKGRAIECGRVPHSLIRELCFTASLPSSLGADACPLVPS